MTDSTATTRARAHSNIALIKYWGKRDAALNLPAVGSISITLDALYTDTTCTWGAHGECDQLWVGGESAPAGRVTAFCNLVRDMMGSERAAHVSSDNNFPTGAGLASSASAFAALALAATRSAKIELSPRELSILARQGSGSAARSVFGGFVEMRRGEREDGLDAYGEPLSGADEWPLEVVVAITTHAAKTIDSTTGMTDTATRSDFFDAWVAHADGDLEAMRDAIAGRDFDALGALSEHSCLKMHGLMLSTRPGLIYWTPATVAAMHEVRRLRADGVAVYFTIDAGPQVKALCAPGYGEYVARRLEHVPGVESARLTRLGPGVHVIE